MLFLVFSDSHGRADRIASILRTRNDSRDVLFLGDGLRDIAALRAEFPDHRFRCVRGNCDGLSLAEAAPTEDSFSLFGHRVLMMHGHLAAVKRDLATAEALALARGADLLLYGHTHIPETHYLSEEGLYVCNPGSIGHPEDATPTYALVDILPDGIMISHVRMPY